MVLGPPVPAAVSGGPSAPLVVPGLFDSPLLTWILFGLVVYWLGLVFLRNRGLLPDFVGTQGPIVTLHTVRGKKVLDRLSGPKRFWRAWANFGVGIALVVMAAMFVFLLMVAVTSVLSPEPTQVQEPRNILVIPGVNDFLPLSAAPGIVFGLFVGLVVHEGAHGLLCRVEDIEIESMGLAMLAFVPMGAFVEPDDESSREASRGGQTRMFAAGVTSNFAVTLLSFALLFWLVGTAVAVAPGAAVGDVVPGSPADEADIEPHDRITAIDGTPVEDNLHYQELLADAEGESVTVELNDGERVATVDRALVVTAALEDGPVEIDNEDVIREVNGEPVATEGEFLEAVGDDEVVTVSVDPADGEPEERTIPVGAAVQVLERGPLADAGAPVGDVIVVTAVDGERIRDADALHDHLDGVDDGDEITVSAFTGGDHSTEDEPDEFTVTYAEGPQFSVAIIDGISGFATDDIGTVLYPAQTFLSFLGGGDGSLGLAIADSFFGQIVVALLLPVAALSGFPFNFAGFSGGVQNFYEVQGLLSGLGDSTIFLLANLLFWTGWINLNLGFFNCIPAFPLDGGHILRTSTEAVLSRLPAGANRGMVRAVTTTVGLAMLVSIILMIFGPRLFAG